MNRSLIALPRLATVLTSASLVALTGCAGGPIAVANAEGGVPVQVGEDTIVVSQRDGLWQAGFKDYMAKTVFSNNVIVMQRKARLSMAIESVSKCKVIDSTADEMARAIVAQVRC